MNASTLMEMGFESFKREDYEEGVRCLTEAIVSTNNAVLKTYLVEHYLRNFKVSEKET